MAFFSKKTWKDRLVEYAGRRKITNVSTMVAQIVDVERAEGIVSEEGNALSAANMNDLEQRVADGFTSVQRTTDTLTQNLASGQIEFSFQDGKGVYRKKGADTWFPFSGSLVLMNGTASYAYSGVSGTYAALFELDNFDFSNYRQISIKNLANFGYEVTCGTKVFSSDGTYDVSDLKAAKLKVMYHGNVGNQPIQLRIELIP